MKTSRSGDCRPNTPMDHADAKQKADIVLRSYHPQLRKYLNFDSIYAHLNSRGLLPPNLDQSKLVSSTTTTQRKIDLLVAWLPKCGKENYLDLFIDSLKESSGEAGHAHDELCESLEMAYAKLRQEGGTQKETSIIVHTSECEESVLMTEFTSFPKDNLTKKGIPIADGSDDPWWKHGKMSKTNCCSKNWILCYVIPSAVLLTFGLIAIVTLSQVQSAKRAPAPSMIFSVTETVLIDLGVQDLFWYKSAEIQLDEECGGEIRVIQGKSCDELPTRSSPTNFTDFILYTYLLPGSTIYLSFPDTEEIGNSSAMFYIVRSIELYSIQYELFNQGSEIDCSSSADDPNTVCIDVSSHRGMTISYTVRKPEYYSILYDPEYRRLVGSPYTNITYNLRDVIETLRPTITPIPRGRTGPTPFTISDNFNFERKKCILFTSACDRADDLYTLQVKIANIRRRTDLIIFAVIVSFACIICAVAAAAILHMCWRRYSNNSKAILRSTNAIFRHDNEGSPEHMAQNATTSDLEDTQLAE